ncbi:MAG: hypothetical protein ACJ789_04985 [Thermomicrobiales bacterium]
MHTTITGIIVVGGSLLLTLLGVALVRRLVSHRTLAGHNDVAGFVYATTGVTYAVILAFVVIAVWDQYDTTSEVADRESNALAALYRLANGFPAPARMAAQSALLDYAEAVIDEEWPAMTHQEAPSPRTSMALTDLYRVYEQPDVVTAVNPAQYTESLRLLNEVSADRRGRILASRTGLPTILWAVLVGGGVLLIAFAFLFGVESPLSQAAIMGTLAVTVAMLLFVVSDVQRPFQGGLQVTPEGLHLLLEQFGPAGTTATPTP